MKRCSVLNRIGFIFSLTIALPSSLLAEGKVWSLAELENRVAENNLEIHSIQSEHGIKNVERDTLESRFQPTLHAKAGFISEKTIDEDRTGPVATLEGRWNIYRGGRDELAKKTSDLEIRAVDLELAARKQSLTFELRSLFYNLLALKEKKKLLKGEMQVNDRQRKVAQGRASSGVATRADELEFRLRGQELQSTESSLQAEEEKNLVTIKNIANIAQDEKVVVEGSFPRPSAIDPKILSNDSPAILRLKNTLEIISQEKNSINSTYKPEIDAFANVGKIYPSEKFKKVESVLGVTLSMPLYDGRLQQSALQIAELSKQKAQLEIQKLELDTTSMIESVEIERKEIERLREINDQRLAYAQKYLTTTVQEYDRGVKNSPDVVGALEHLLSSKVRRIDLALQSAVLGAKAMSLKGNPIIHDKVTGDRQ